MSEGARAVWVFFGDVKGVGGVVSGNTERDVAKLKGQYLSLKPQLESKGYTLHVQEGYVAKAPFLKLVQESLTWAVVWHSHGSPYQIFGADGQVIRPTEIRPCKNVQFVALLGCDVRQGKAAWLKAFGLTQFTDRDMRFAASGDKLFGLWNYGSTGAYGRVEYPTYARQFAERSSLPDAYTFKQWIEKLPAAVD